MSNNDYSLASARAAASEGRLDRWVSDFLASPGSDNADLADLLEEEGLAWEGPVRLPIDELNRLAGPPGDPVLVEVPAKEWRDDVHEMREEVEDGWEPPPVIVVERGGQFVLEDGNHRVESLRQAGETEVWALLAHGEPQPAPELAG